MIRPAPFLLSLLLAAPACRVDPAAEQPDGTPPDLGARCSAAADCDDGDPCTRDRCLDGRCVVDRAAVAPLEALGTIPVEGVLQGLALAGDRLLLTWRTDAAAGLTEWDLSTLPAAMQTLRRQAEADEGAFGAVAVVGDRTYVGEAPARLRALDATGQSLGVQPTADPVQAITPLPGTARVVAAEFGKGLEVLGFGDPASPRRVARLDTPGRALAVAVRPNRWYVADGLNGLVIVDARDVADPRRLGEPVPTLGRALGVDERDGLALLAEAGAGLGIINLRAEPLPARLATLPLGEAHAVAWLGPALAAVAAEDGLHLVDLLRPSAPTVWGTATTAGPTRQLAADGARVAVGHGDGVTVFEVACAAPAEADGGLDGGVDGAADGGPEGAP
ncbi:MAG: hypothetical protein H6702_14635 [Myxococcales bacterium]|nr:hypothetical protein [Myxococcales bacterium]